LKFNYDFLGLKSLLDNLGFLRGSQTLTSSTPAAAALFGSSFCRARCGAGTNYELHVYRLYLAEAE